LCEFIVVEKLSDLPESSQAKLWLENEDYNSTAIYEPAAFFHSQMPILNKRGMMGYYYIYPHGLNARFITADHSIEQVKKTMEPVLAAFGTFKGVKPVIHQYAEFKSYKEWFDLLFGALTPADPNAPRELEGAYPQGITRMDSRLMAADHLTSPDLAVALQRSMPQMPKGMLRGHLIGGGEVLSRSLSTSVNPAWRRTYVHLIGTGEGSPNVTALKDVAPRMGAYANEVRKTLECVLAGNNNSN